MNVTSVPSELKHGQKVAYFCVLQPTQFSVPARPSISVRRRRLSRRRVGFFCCDGSKIKMARKPGKKQKENPEGAPGKVKDKKEIREEYREDKTGTTPIFEFGVTLIRLALTRVRQRYQK